MINKPSQIQAQINLYAVNFLWVVVKFKTCLKKRLHLEIRFNNFRYLKISAFQIRLF